MKMLKNIKAGEKKQMCSSSKNRTYEQSLHLACFKNEDKQK